MYLTWKLHSAFDPATVEHSPAPSGSVVSPPITPCSPDLPSPFKWTTSHLKNESLSFVNTLYCFSLPVTSSPHQKSTWLVLPQCFIQRSTVAMCSYLSVGCLFFLTALPSLKPQFAGFPFLPRLPFLSLHSHFWPIYHWALHTWLHIGLASWEL